MQILSTGFESDTAYHPLQSLKPPQVHEALPSPLGFHRRISVLAAKLGLLARDLREEEERSPHEKSRATIQGRQERIRVLQDSFRRTWSVQMPSSVAGGYCNHMVPVGSRGIFEHVSPESVGNLHVPLLIN